MENTVNVVGAAFVRGGKIFAAKRSYGSRYVIHKYEFVGGKVECGEEERDALARECREELGTEITVYKLAGVSEYEYPDKRVRIAVYFCEMLTEYTSKEHEECIWLPLDAIEADEWAPADRDILCQIIQRFAKPYSFVTGATGYIGKAFCRLLASRGENLFLTGRSAEKLSALKAELTAEFPSVKTEFYPCDLSDENSRAELFNSAAEFTFGRLVNVAGADIQKSFEKYDQDKIIFQTRSLFEGAVSVTRFCLRARTDNFSVINISSVSGLYPMPYFAIYSALKGAIADFSVALSEEYKGSGVTFTAVLPGAVYTRPDVIEYIKTQGLWGKLAAKTPQFIAEKSLKAAQKGKRRYIPGAANKIMRFFTAAIPERIKLRLIAYKWSKTEKDAF